MVKRLPRGTVSSSVVARDFDKKPVRFALSPEKSVDQLIKEVAVVVIDHDNNTIEGIYLKSDHKRVVLYSAGKLVEMFNPKQIITIDDLELNPLISLFGTIIVVSSNAISFKGYSSLLYMC